MKKKIIGVLLLLMLTLGFSFVVYAENNEFTSLTLEQLQNHTLLDTLTTEELSQLLGVNLLTASSTLTFDRYVLDELSDEELDILHAPFRETVATLNELMGTNVQSPTLDDYWWCRERVTNVVSGYLPFECWVEIIRTFAQMSVGSIRNNALYMNIIESNLSWSEYESLMYLYESLDILYMIHAGYDLRDVIDDIESQTDITDVTEVEPIDILPFATRRFIQYRLWGMYEYFFDSRISYNTASRHAMGSGIKCSQSLDIAKRSRIYI